MKWTFFVAGAGLLSAAAVLGVVALGPGGGALDGVAGKDESRLVASAGSPSDRAAIRHELPSFKWFGERDESRLPSRPLGSVKRVIETEEGMVFVLDAGSNVVVRHDPENATTTLAQDPAIPAVTPRQAFDSPGEIVFFEEGRARAE